MQLREWILEGTRTLEGKPARVYTTPNAKRAYAIAKMEFLCGENACFVHVKKGRIIKI